MQNILSQMKIPNRFLLTLFAVGIFFVNQLQAQTTITGKVTDTNGSPVPGANVVVKNTYDGATTDAKGQFNFTSVEQGDVSISASMIGFEGDEKKATLKGEQVFVNFILKEKTNELNTVTITAGAFEASDEKKMVILRPLDIVTTAGAAGDIYGALQTLPGMQPIQEQEGMFVRGGDAVEAKTIIDGIAVNNPYFNSVPDVPQRGRFSPFLFKGTNFSTGGYSAQYGQAMSSALVLESQDLPARSMGNISLMSVGGGGGYTKKWKNTSLGLFANYINLTPYFKLVKQGRDWDSPPQNFSGSLMLRQKTSETGIFKAFINYQYSDLSLNYKNIEDPTGESKSHFSQNNYDIFSTFSYKEILSKVWTVNAATSYSKNLNRIYPEPQHLVFKNETEQGRLTISRAIGELTTVRAGGEAQIVSYRNLYNNYRVDTNEMFSAVFLEGDVYITRKLVARLGGRLENSYLLGASNIAPRVSLAYKTGKFSQVSFAYGDFYQTPDQRYMQSSDLNKFQKATHYILNFQHVDEKRTFRVEGYYKDYQNLIRTFPDTNTDGSGYAQGFDIFWRDKKTFKYTDYWISYSYLDTKRKYLSYPYEANPTYASKHVVSVVYKRWFPKLNSSLGFTYAYATGRPYYNPNKTSENNFLTDYTKDYHNLSLTGSYLTSIKKHFTVIAASIGNVLGIDNVYSYRYSLNGQQREAIGAPSKYSFFIGMFITIGEDKTDDL